jgi:hypothetical protein
MILDGKTSEEVLELSLHALCVLTSYRQQAKQNSSCAYELHTSQSLFTFSPFGMS